MSKEETPIIEKLFGKAPKKGYKFTHVDVTLTDNDVFKGFHIQWGAKGVGFGEVFFGWGIDKEVLKDFPKQQGFYLDTECMSDEFIQALMKKALPKMTALILKARNG